MFVSDQINKLVDLLEGNYADDAQVRNEHYTDYIACQSDLEVMYGYWCRPGFKSGHQLFNLPIFRKRLESYLQKDVE